MKSKRSYKFWLVSRFIFWRLLLIIFAAFAIQTLQFKPSFPYWEILLEPKGHPIFWSWANFDGVHYLTIAKQGYTAQYTQAFFPLYPYAIGYIDRIFNNLIASGLLISHVSFLITLFVFYKLILLDRGVSTAKRTLTYLLLFPTSYYFGSLYSESLFLMLVLTSFYAARKKKWWLAGILGAIASATRIFGIFLFPALIVEWYISGRTKSSYSPFELLKSILPITLIPLGLLYYMNYLNRAFSDPLLFLTSQPAFGAQRSSDKIILLYQVVWRYLKMLATVDPSTILYYTVSLEFATGILFLLLSVIAFKYTRASYAIFGILSYLTPTFTGTFSSMPRYVLILFPSFILLGLVKNRRFQRVWWLVSAILLAINTMLFVRGYWVA